MFPDLDPRAEAILAAPFGVAALGAATGFGSGQEVRRDLDRALGTTHQPTLRGEAKVVTVPTSPLEGRGSDSPPDPGTHSPGDRRGGRRSARLEWRVPNPSDRSHMTLEASIGEIREIMEQARATQGIATPKGSGDHGKELEAPTHTSLPFTVDDLPGSHFFSILWEGE